MFDPTVMRGIHAGSSNMNISVCLNDNLWTVKRILKELDDPIVITKERQPRKH